MHETSLISSLVELTRQRDQLSIRAKLLSTLMEATDAAWIVLCRLTAEDVIDVLDRIPSPSPGKSSQHYPTALFGHIEPFQDCARVRRPIWVTNLDPYQAIIFAMADGTKSHDFVVLFNPELEGRDERTAASILDLYDNFQTLVIENTQDALTGLLNRGAFDRDLEATASVVGRRKRHGDPPHGGGYLAMLDIDHFKRINDEFGHLYGDEVLLLFAKVVRQTFRSSDKLYRYGGEEFAVILDNAPLNDVRAILEGFREAVAHFDFPQVGHVTVSIGIATISPDDLPSNVIDRADHALYRAKENGRNQIQLFDIETKASNGTDSDVELF